MPSLEREADEDVYVQLGIPGWKRRETFRDAERTSLNFSPAETALL